MFDNCPGNSNFQYRRILAPLGFLLLLGATMISCARQPIDRLIADLDDPSRREQAIEGLMLLLRQTPPNKQGSIKYQIVTALTEAYREDESRNAIVAALASLADRRAEVVFAAALQDAERGGPYYEAAVRSAQSIGELGLKQHVPLLIAVLKKLHASLRSEQGRWLERAIIQSLDRLANPEAVDVLIKVLKTDPVRQDFYLNKLAAIALGKLKDRRAVSPLISSLATQSHGLLLFEESRQALCRIGTPAVNELLNIAARRDRHNQPASNAAAAASLLGDIAEPSLAPKIKALLKPNDPDDYQLAVVETLLRLGQTDALDHLWKIIHHEKTALTFRRQAADLLGWYGSPDKASESLDVFCHKGGEAAQNVLCWSVALAYTRAASGKEMSYYDRLLSENSDEVTRKNMQTYRPRLALVDQCGEDIDCYQRACSNKEWREQERAALELGRQGLQLDDKKLFEVAKILVQTFGSEQAEVRQAVLISLERLTRGKKSIAQLVSALESQLQSKTTPPLSPPALLSRAICLSQRLNRILDKAL